MRGNGTENLVGGLGRDILIGGGGEYVCLWKNSDMDNNKDSILGFKLNQDKLCFSDLIEEKADIGNLLSSGKISLHADSSSSLNLTVNQQQIEVRLDSSLTDQQVNAINSGNYTAQRTILEVI